LSTDAALHQRGIGVDKMTFGFNGTDGAGGAVFGTADRITGDVEATMERWNDETNKLQWTNVTIRGR
jgi:hypothetical protein